MRSRGVIGAQESPIRGVQRVLVAELDRAMDALSHKSLSDSVLHDVRKSLERARAMLRLLREALGEKDFNRENKTLRNAGRLLTPARDSNVLLGVIDDLTKQVDDDSSAAGMRALRVCLNEERRESQAALKPRKLSGTLNAILEVKRRMHSVSQQRLDSVKIDKALGTALKKTRRGYRDASRDASNERLHEWRKQAKQFLNQLLVVSPLNPDGVRKMAKSVHRLTDDLGDDHDLAVLGTKFDQYARQNSAIRHARDVAGKILKRRRAKLQRKADKLGQRLNREKPRRLRKRVARYLNYWSQPFAQSRRST